MSKEQKPCGNRCYWEGQPHEAGIKQGLFVEYSALERAQTERDEYIAKYRQIKTANPELTRTDHVRFGRMMEQLAEKDETVTHLRQSLENAHNELRLRDAEIERLKTWADQLQVRSEDWNESAGDFKKAIAERDREISRVKDSNAKAAINALELLNTIAEKDAEIASLNEHLEICFKKKMERKELLAERDREIASLKDQLQWSLKNEAQYKGEIERLRKDNLLALAIAEKFADNRDKAIELIEELKQSLLWLDYLPKAQEALALIAQFKRENEK